LAIINTVLEKGLQSTDVISALNPLIQAAIDKVMLLQFGILG